MNIDQYEKEKKEDKPVLAICYDFDRTLTPKEMQAQGYIQDVGEEEDSFWNESNSMASDNDMDQNLAYMRKMIEKARGKFYPNKDVLAKYGASLELYPGVEDWFERMIDFGHEYGIIVEHYIISSGLKEIIDGTVMAKKKLFKKIYASSYYFDERNEPVWPSQTINYTNKTQFLFRIKKGILDINDPDINNYYPPEETRVPFENMVYIGDSATDVPCMKLVSTKGGYSIGVYDPKTNNKSRVYEMIRSKRISYYAEADYREGKTLDTILKLIIEKTAISGKLINVHEECTKEANKVDDNELKTGILISKLEKSSSYRETHEIIDQMSMIESTNWTQKQADSICKAAINNSQVLAIVNDWKIRKFFKDIFKIYKISKPLQTAIEERFKE